MIYKSKLAGVWWKCDCVTAYLPYFLSSVFIFPTLVSVWQKERKKKKKRSPSPPLAQTLESHPGERHVDLLNRKRHHTHVILSTPSPDIEFVVRGSEQLRATAAWTTGSVGVFRYLLPRKSRMDNNKKRNKTKARHRQMPPCDMTGAIFDHAHPADWQRRHLMLGEASVRAALSQAWPIAASFPRKVFPWCFRQSEEAADCRDVCPLGPAIGLSVGGIGQRQHGGVWHPKVTLGSPPLIFG